MLGKLSSRAETAVETNGVLEIAWEENKNGAHRLIRGL